MKLDDTLNTAMEIFKEVALYGPAEFYSCFGNADDLARLSSYSEATARNYVILQSLSEVQKAGLSLRRWLEAQKASQQERGNPVWQLDLAALADEQGVWQRKLAEVLVHAIGFAATSSPDYYYHYLLVADLERCQHDRREQRDFFGADSGTLTAEATRLYDTVAELEKHGVLDLSKCWYLSSPEPISARPLAKLRQGLTSSLRQQLIFALGFANDAEKRALGFSYRQAISEPSRGLHFSLLPSIERLLIHRFRFGCTQVGMLSLAILARMHALSGLTPAGVASDFVRSYAQNKTAQPHPFVGDAVAGDFVVVTLDVKLFLGEVEEIASNTYGYERYRIAFIDELPFGTVKEDWVLPNRVTVFQRRSELMPKLIAQIDESIRTGPPQDPKVLAAIRDPANLSEAARTGVREIWRLALRGVYEDAFAKQRAGSVG